MVHSALFTPYFRYFMLRGSLPEPYFSPAIRLLSACFQAAAVGLGKREQSGCCQVIAPRKSPAHRQTAYYSRPRKLSPRQPEQRYGAAVTLLQLSRNNAPRLPEKPYSPSVTFYMAVRPFHFNQLLFKKGSQKAAKYSHLSACNHFSFHLNEYLNGRCKDIWQSKFQTSLIAMMSHRAFASVMLIYDWFGK